MTHATAGSNNARLVRIESKLHRLLIGLGMDSDGNPQTGVVLSGKDLEDIIDRLDSYLNLMDDHNIEAGYDDTTALYNRLIDIRNSRCRNRPTS